MKRQLSVFGVMMMGILAMATVPVLAADHGMMRQPQPAPEVLPIPVPRPPAPFPERTIILPENPATPPGVPVPYPNTDAPQPGPAMK